MLNKQLKKILHVYESNLSMLLLLIAIYFTASFIVNIPYINLLNIYVSNILYLISWIFIVFVFKPKKELILKIALGLFVIDFFLMFLHGQNLVELLGNVSYLLLTTYILISIKEEIWKKVSK